MSGLLERMILRTRTPLSPLEPRSRPRFAPSSSLLEADDQLFQPIEAAVPHGLTPGSGRQPPASNRGPVDDGSPVLPTDDPVKTVQRRPSSPVPEPANAGADRGRRTAPRDDDHGSTTAELAAPAPGQVPVPAAPARGVPGGMTSAAASGRRAADPSAPLSAQVPAGEQAAAPRSMADLLARPSGAGPEGRAQAVASRDRARKSGGESQTTVTVSIGHIEVRAAPGGAPAPSPRRFRPQVSLAAFLDGKTERG